jgi:hypothetical protein
MADAISILTFVSWCFSMAAAVAFCVAHAAMFGTAAMAATAAV